MLLGYNVANGDYGQGTKTNFHIHVWSHIQNGNWLPQLALFLYIIWTIALSFKKIKSIF